MKSLIVAVLEKQRATCEPVIGPPLPGHEVRGEGLRIYCCEPAPGG